tara:strand:+ start:657 stop:1028 length:372 start_codon:yes stop_codon:yes gene_type:complete
MDENTIIGCCKSGYQKNKFKKLKKGDLNIQDELDLHGCSAYEAEVMIGVRIPQWQLNNQLVILIQHGKGKGILKKLVDDFLQNDPNVLAYHSAQPKDGGTGAVYVHLKNINKSNNSDEYYDEE